MITVFAFVSFIALTSLLIWAFNEAEKDEDGDFVRLHRRDPLATKDAIHKIRLAIWSDSPETIIEGLNALKEVETHLNDNQQGD